MGLSILSTFEGGSHGGWNVIVGEMMPLNIFVQTTLNILFKCHFKMSSSVVKGNILSECISIEEDL